MFSDYFHMTSAHKIKSPKKTPLVCNFYCKKSRILRNPEVSNFCRVSDFTDLLDKYIYFFFPIFLKIHTKNSKTYHQEV